MTTVKGNLQLCKDESCRATHLLTEFVLIHPSCQTIVAIKENGHLQELIPIVCRYPLYSLDDDVDSDPDKIQSYNRRSKNSIIIEFLTVL